jgi:hypothetical protein
LVVVVVVRFSRRPPLGDEDNNKDRFEKSAAAADTIPTSSVTASKVTNTVVVHFVIIFPIATFFVSSFVRTKNEK